MNQLRRLIHPEIRIESEPGLVTYVASDESVDSYREVIRARGWKFDQFRKNAPFVNSHRYESIDDQLGRVVDYRIEQDRLVEVVQWAVDVPENQMARLGYRMTQAGYLKAVSVGFFPVKYLTPSDGTPYEAELGTLATKERPTRIYTEQQQVELSAVILPANPNALTVTTLARAFREGVLSESDLEFLGRHHAAQDSPNVEPAVPAAHPADAETALRLATLSLNLRIKTIADNL